MKLKQCVSDYFVEIGSGCLNDQSWKKYGADINVNIRKTVVDCDSICES